MRGYLAIPLDDAVVALRELFQLTCWLARTYGRTARPAPGLAFTASALPKATPGRAQTAEQLKQLEARLREREEKLAALLADKSTLDGEVERLRAEVTAAKQAAAAQPDTHDFPEAETRDYFIDLLLKEGGWPLDQPRDGEFEVCGQEAVEGVSAPHRSLCDARIAHRCAVARVRRRRFGARPCS